VEDDPQKLRIFEAERVLDAAGLAARTHAGQLDKGGEPYLWHVLRVGMSLLPDVDLAVLGILHDALEDAPTSAGLQVVEALHGDTRLIKAILALTRKRGEPYEDYLRRVRDDGLAVVVKRADILDNLSPRRLALVTQRDGRKGTCARLIGKYQMALQMIARRVTVVERQEDDEP
jgi:(p)ppGpp synthase/HD superfamily hydrolase